MKPVAISTIPPREIMKGITGKYFHTPHMSIGWIEARAGHTVPLHAHIHEQVSFVQEGQMAFTIEGKEIMLESGMAITIAPNQMHGARAITDCRLIDVFCPAREDYK